jgi:hypothetical protein
MKHGFFTTLLNFDDDDEVQEVMTWFKEQAADFYDSGIQMVVLRVNKYLKCNVWRLAVRYVIYIYIHIYMSLVG